MSLSHPHVLLHSNIKNMPSSQHGMALVIALVFLLLMTLIGVTAMQGTTMQERMAGNMQDRNVGFQATEAALRAGEWRLEDPSLTAVTFTAFLAELDADDVNKRLTLAMKDQGKSIHEWDGSNERGKHTMGAFNLEPVYYIDPPRFVRDPDHRDDLDAGGKCRRIYVITSRGEGRSNAAVVILQTSFDPPAADLVFCPDDS